MKCPSEWHMRCLVVVKHWIPEQHYIFLGFPSIQVRHVFQIDVVWPWLFLFFLLFLFFFSWFLCLTLQKIKTALHFVISLYLIPDFFIIIYFIWDDLFNLIFFSILSPFTFYIFQIWSYFFNWFLLFEMIFKSLFFL